MEPSEDTSGIYGEILASNCRSLQKLVASEPSNVLSGGCEDQLKGEKKMMQAFFWLASFDTGNLCSIDPDFLLLTYKRSMKNFRTVKQLKSFQPANSQRVGNCLSQHGRQEKIDQFKAKRTTRVLKKKISYTRRKLAETRCRYKGRFVSKTEMERIQNS